MTLRWLRRKTGRKTGVMHTGFDPETGGPKSVPYGEDEYETVLQHKVPDLFTDDDGWIDVPTVEEK